ncbi:hypothetical protein OV203_25155 [Nannocystis sp. ILAH1]|uniref:hypothetical protein n=1 Tax=Nannocystis sp. ILAH1 TaxID=2996789 RepID=UPI00226E9687|nr:hypothetical protein [Nannocystis sp. ILAH1]MCY0990454.1 hypothetical protein [Nannocystis sp. ILAH1]
MQATANKIFPEEGTLAMHLERVETRSEQHHGTAVEPWSNLDEDDFLLAAEASLEALREGEDEDELSPDDIEEVPEDQ